MSIRILAVVGLSAIALAGCGGGGGGGNTTTVTDNSTTTTTTTNTTTTPSNVGRSDSGKPVSGPSVNSTP